MERGYSTVFNLQGGIFEWMNEDRPLVDPEGRKTLRIHAYSHFWGLWLTRGEKVYGLKSSPLHE